jgi:type II secretory pathway component GspD/PulD (secretin)
MPRTLKFLAGVLALSLATATLAQTSDTKVSQAPSTHEPEPDRSQFVVKTYYLANATDQNDANEILIAIRNTLSPVTRMYLVRDQNAIVLSAPPSDQALAQRLITELDRPHKAYRLTFTLADSDNGKRVGVQHFAMVVAGGQRVTLKQGSKIPVITGSYEAKSDTGTQTQFQYLDIGMGFDATLDDTPNGLRLRCKVDQSSLADEHMSGPLAPEPIVRQTSLEGTSAIILGKPITLGSVDITGTTRHVDIEVVAEPIS